MGDSSLESQVELTDNNFDSKMLALCHSLRREPSKALDFELAKANGQKLSSMDEARLRNIQLRRARKMYLDTTVLSEREPLNRWGWRGSSEHDWRYAMRWRNRAWQWQKNIGVKFLNRMTGGNGNWYEGEGYRPRRGNFHTMLAEKHGIRDGFLSIFRQAFLRIPLILFGIVWGGWGTYQYYANWCHYETIHSFHQHQQNPPAECLPDDDKICARMNDLVSNRYNRGMTLVEGAKSYPLGTRYDWLSGEPVLPKDPNYYWVDGRPIRKDRGYFNPGPSEVMGKTAYEEDGFFDKNGKPRTDVMVSPYRHNTVNPDYAKEKALAINNQFTVNRKDGKTYDDSNPIANNWR